VFTIELLLSPRFIATLTRKLCCSGRLSTTCRALVPSTAQTVQPARPRSRQVGQHVCTPHGLDHRLRRKKMHPEHVRRRQIMPWGRLWVSEHTTVPAGGTCAVVGVAATVRIERAAIT